MRRQKIFLRNIADFTACAIFGVEYAASQPINSVASSLRMKTEKRIVGWTMHFAKKSAMGGFRVKKPTEKELQSPVTFFHPFIYHLAVDIIDDREPLLTAAVFYRVLDTNNFSFPEFERKVLCPLQCDKLGQYWFFGSYGSYASTNNDVYEP